MGRARFGIGGPAGLVGLVGLLCGVGGCESGVTVDVTYRVPAGIAEAYPEDAPGVLVSSRIGPLAPVCGVAVDYVEYSDGFGCKPEGAKERIEAWVVPMPDSWDRALCDEPDALSWVSPSDTGFDAADRFPTADLPDPTPDDPFGATEATWRAVPVCGGILRAEVVVGPPG